MTDQAHTNADRPGSRRPLRAVSPAAQQPDGPQLAPAPSGPPTVPADPPRPDAAAGEESGSGPGPIPGPSSDSSAGGNPHPAQAVLCPRSIPGSEYFPCFAGSLPARPGVTVSVNEPDTAPCPAGSGCPILASSASVWSFPSAPGGSMTAARPTGPIDNPDDSGGPQISRAATRPTASEQVAPPGGTSAAEPRGPVEAPPDAEDTGRLALPPPTRPDGGKGRPGRRWVFHGEAQTISGPEAEWTWANLAAVTRDLLVWSAGERAADGDTSDEEAA
ncbi:hypothetical protein Ga0074812_10812 [Parafrankia irregularis]|uniref:Uncharacterized protein n=1 Tax=Parafrankia irregularis TaxID=795642 RepID=A0A0S4QLE8_9ACTN|nr:hypothetical protein Ga0074812_10812 [Parafrankia irregularis]